MIETEIPKVVITGGPCAGKSSGLAYLYKRLESYGRRPILVPETATITILAGINPSIVSPYEFQKGIFDFQVYIENYFENFARNLPPNSHPVLICDRGRLDGRAFCKPALWDKLLKERGTNNVEQRDVPYKAVIHMITAAEGALDFYTLDNNGARTETPAQARRSDHKLRQAWLSHPHHRIVGNKGDFAHKISEVGKLVLEALGLPEPIETERSFRLPRGSATRLRKMGGVKLAPVDIEQTYLLSPPGEERRVRRRSQGKFSAYFYCTKKHLSRAQRIEQECIIAPQEYAALLRQRDPKRQPILKTRYCYFFNEQFQELDVFHSPKQNFEKLEIETDGEVYLPPCFKTAVEVTGDKAYSNAALAGGKSK